MKHPVPLVQGVVLGSPPTTGSTAEETWQLDIPEGIQVFVGGENTALSSCLYAPQSVLQGAISLERNIVGLTEESAKVQISIW